MSHDAKHKRLKNQMKALARATGLKWIPCPNAADEEGDYPDRELECKKGFIDFGRGARECDRCDGAAAILVKADGDCACPESENPAPVKMTTRGFTEPHCSKCRQPLGIKP